MSPTTTTALCVVLLAAAAAAAAAVADGELHLGDSKQPLQMSSKSDRTTRDTLAPPSKSSRSNGVQTMTSSNDDQVVENLKSHRPSGAPSSTENSKIKSSSGTVSSSKDAGSRRHKHHSRRPPHHISRRSFDSINSGDLGGMNQNFVGERSAKQGSPYYRRRSYVLQGKRSVEDELPTKARFSFGWSPEHDASYNDKNSQDEIDDRYGKYEYILANSDKLQPFEKRGFDSISRWNGGVSGISQNFIGPKRGDYSSFSRGLGHHMGSMFGINNGHGYQKRQFDSISYGPLYGLRQNNVDKKDQEDRQRWWPGGFRDNFILKRALENIATLHDSNEQMDFPTHQDKRQFDSIAHQSPIFGMQQNHIGKRQFDSIATGGSLNTFGQNFITKRQFDSINSGSGFSNMNQNFVNKRDLEIDPNVLKRFDSISSGSLNGLGQNFINKRVLGSSNYLDNWDAVDKSNDLRTFDLMERPTQHFIYRRSTASRGLEESKNSKKRQFDSINSSAFAGMRQNFLAKKSSRMAETKAESAEKKSFDTIGRTRLGGMSQNFISKRILDSINKGKIRGLHQNFVSKRGFDSINGGQFGGMRQNFVSKRGFDSINGGQFGGMHQNFVSKRGFDSINGGHFGGMRQNFVSKRGFDSINGGQFGGMRQNFVSKRGFDSINGGQFGGMRQNFVSRKRFDSISNNRLFGMGQNFVSKRYFDSINDNRLGGMKQNFISKRNFDTISRGPMAGFRQNFVSKKSSGTTDESLGQNIISERLHFLASQGGSGHHGESIMTHVNSLNKAGTDDKMVTSKTGGAPNVFPGSESDIESEDLSQGCDNTETDSSASPNLLSEKVKNSKTSHKTLR